MLPNGLYQARAWHSATMLPDGRVLVVGGVGINNKVISGAEIYDPEMTSSEPLPSARLNARAYHTATLLTTGQVLIAGGSSSNEHALTLAELFDPKTKTAITLPARLSNARQKHKATLLADGNVLLEAGVGSNSEKLASAELFNSETRTFVSTTLSASQDQGDVNQPSVAASLPADGATDVPVDTRIAIRFSKSLRVESLNTETVRFTSSDGSIVAAKLVPAENGRLAFFNRSRIITAGHVLHSHRYSMPPTAPPRLLPQRSPSPLRAIRKPNRCRPVMLTGFQAQKTSAVTGASKGRKIQKKKLSRHCWPLPGGDRPFRGRLLTLLGKPLADVTISVDGHSVTD